MVGSIAELCHRVEWRAELMDNGLGYLDEEISKQSVKDATWSSLLPMVRCEKERDNLREEP